MVPGPTVRGVSAVSSTTIILIFYKRHSAIFKFHSSEMAMEAVKTVKGVLPHDFHGAYASYLKRSGKVSTESSFLFCQNIFCPSL